MYQSKCLTPGAIYSSSVNSKRVAITVEVPHNGALNESDAASLQDAIHDALEPVIAQYYYDVCPKSNLGEHWWLLLHKGRKCYLCKKIEE